MAKTFLLAILLLTLTLSATATAFSPRSGRAASF
jgi:hypothetical protein